MPVTDSFLATCRAIVQQLPELTAFKAARALTDVGTRTQRTAAWQATYGDNVAGLSPAYKLRAAVRNTVNAQADAAGTLSLLDRESAYRTLAAEVVVTPARPASEADENAALEAALREDRLS